MDQIIAPYLSPPLANSTKIQNNAYTAVPDINPTKQGYRYTSFRSLDITPSVIEMKKTDDSKNTTFTYNLTDLSVSSNSTSKNDSSNSKTSPARAKCKSDGCKKPVVARKSIAAKKPIEPIKAVANNCKTKGVTVEKILKQIKMTKYQQSFKKIDVCKFQDLREIDLNAIGITRPSEIKIFMDAIKKTKSDMLVIKQN